MPVILQRHYHAAYIIGPWLVRIALYGLFEVERIDREPRDGIEIRGD